MPRRQFSRSDLVQIRERYGLAMMNEAARLTLVDQEVLLPEDSVASAFTDDLTRPQHPFDVEGFLRHLEMLKNVGKPLTPAPPTPGAAPVVGGRIGIQGNPPGIDDLYNSGWHFAQENGWDAWFNIIPRIGGGYWIASPACRTTGNHGAAKLGKETEALLDQNYLITFVIEWPDGARGSYNGGFDENQAFRGTVRDLARPSVSWTWSASRMPITALAPSQRPLQPMILVNAYPNGQDSGYTVVVGTSGFQSGEFVQVDGRYIGPGATGEWGTYAAGNANDFGQFSASFGVIKPLNASYVFRAIGASGMQTPEMGF